MLVEFLFYFIFAAIARGPLAFATRWIWAADFAESIETAAVRAPLCLRFPLLLSSVQAGVGLLSPPPPRRGGFILRFSRVWRKLLQLLGLPPRRLPTLSGLRRARAFRQLRPRRAMPRLHGLLSRRIQFSILSSVVAADGRLSRVMRPRRQSVFCPIGRGPQSHPVVASVRSGAGRSRILWSRVAMVGAVRGFPSLPAPAGDAALFAMAVALVPVPQCFYGLRLLPYLWQFSGCETMRFYSP